MGYIEDSPHPTNRKIMKTTPFSVHSSMLLAIAAVMGPDANEYFTLREDKDEVIEVLEGIPDGSGFGPEVSDTLCEYAMDSNRVCGVVVESEGVFGYVLSHYNDKGDIVRFIAIQR